MRNMAFLLCVGHCAYTRAEVEGKAKAIHRAQIQDWPFPRRWRAEKGEPDRSIDGAEQTQSWPFPWQLQSSSAETEYRASVSRRFEDSLRRTDGLLWRMRGGELEGKKRDCQKARIWGWDWQGSAILVETVSESTRLRGLVMRRQKTPPLFTDSPARSESWLSIEDNFYIKGKKCKILYEMGKDTRKIYCEGKGDRKI